MKNIINDFLNLIFPQHCCGCAKTSADVVCNNCFSKITYSPQLIFNHIEPLDFIFSFYHYDGLIRKMLHRIKFKKKKNLFNCFNALIEKDVPFNLSNFHYLIPIPLHPKRLRNRGFNQAEIIGKSFAQRRNLKFSTRFIERAKNTTPLFSLDENQRKKIMGGAFKIAQIPDGFSFIIFDDIVTTATTLIECAKALKNAGAKKVAAITIAHGGRV
jgi:ComF family protein